MFCVLVSVTSVCHRHAIAAHVTAYGNVALSVNSRHVCSRWLGQMLDQIVSRSDLKMFQTTASPIKLEEFSDTFLCFFLTCPDLEPPWTRYNDPSPSCTWSVNRKWHIHSQICLGTFVQFLNLLFTFYCVLLLRFVLSVFTVRVSLRDQKEEVKWSLVILRIISLEEKKNPLHSNFMGCRIV